MSVSWATIILFVYIYIMGLGSSSGKALRYGLDGLNCIPDGRWVKTFLYFFVSRLVLGSTQPPIKWVPGLSNPSVASPTSQLILLPFRPFTYVTAHYPTLPLLHLVTGTSPTSPGEPPMINVYLCTDYLASFCVFYPFHKNYDDPSNFQLWCLFRPDLKTTGWIFIRDRSSPE